MEMGFFGKELRRRYFHFEERLLKRYSINITIDEYYNLSRNYDFEFLRLNDSGDRIVKIIFKGQEIQCIKQNKSKGFLLITPIKPQ